MNAIINWLALNNTLMIKIGFSAIILLIVVYVFRFFFVPRVKEVSAAADLSDNDNISLEKADVVKDGAVALSSEEVTKLQAEISTLKYKLKEAEVEKANLATQAASAAGSSSSPSAGLDMVAEANPQNTAAQGELEEKIKLLEARLSEYEIIAEDIAEISKLRQENEELKAKIAEGGTAAPAVSTEVTEALEALDSVDEDLASFEAATAAVSTEEVSLEAVAQENVSPEASVSEVVDDSQLLDEYVASKTAAEVDDSSRVVITSDVEVTNEEKSSLNEFEQFKKAKKG